jgi:hypothetical protein
MSATPFDSVFKSRAASYDAEHQSAAFDAGQHHSNVRGGLDRVRLDSYGSRSLSDQDISGQPPLFQGREQSVAMKVSAPPMTVLDFSTGIPGQAESSMRMNKAGIMVPQQGETIAFKPPQQGDASSGFKPRDLATLRVADAPATGTTESFLLPKRNPTLHPAEFPSTSEYLPKFAVANVGVKVLKDGMQVTQTAADFSTYTMYKKDDGTSGAIVADPYARKILQEEHDPSGKSTVSKFTYDDVGGKKAMFASRKDVTLPDGTTQSMNYDRYGKVIQA